MTTTYDAWLGNMKPRTNSTILTLLFATCAVGTNSWRAAAAQSSKTTKSARRANFGAELQHGPRRRWDIRGHQFTPTPSDGTNSEPPPCDGDAGDCYENYDAGPACGDGVVDNGEDCDDGNSSAGDGCNGACKVEPFYDCGESGTECVFTIVCGDGQLDPGEWCDDKNTEDGDGCNATCTEQDPSYICCARARV